MAGNHKGGGVKQLVLKHVEKVVALLLVGAAGYVAYSSLSAERLSKSPGDLISQASTAQTAFQQSRWDDVPVEDKKIAYEVASPNLLVNLPEDPYKQARGLDRSVVPPVIDRTDPKLLSASDLEGNAVTAIFAFESEEERKKRLREERAKEERLRKEQEEAQKKGETELLGGGGRGRGGFDAAGEPTTDEKGRKIRPIPGGSRQEGVATTGYERFKAYSVACVLAKAPILDQAKIYEEALRDSRGYSEGVDIPRYVGLIAERAEITGEEDEELKWETVKFGGLSSSKKRDYLSERYLLETIADWIPWPESLVDARYEHPILTMPLPPLVQQNWRPDVVHTEAPLQSETDAKEAAESANENAEGLLPEETDDDNGFARLGGMPAGGEFGGRGGAGGRGLPGRSRGSFGGEFGGGEFGGRGGYGGEFGGGGRGGSRGGGSRGAVGEFSIDPDVPFAMVRIFDFGVLPGRQYRYRVKLVLEDVNNDPRRPEIERYLAPEVLARIKKSRAPLMTEWSDPSPIISVPMAGDAFVEGAKLPSGKAVSSEGTVDLLVQSYAIDDDRRAMKAGVEKSFRIGAVLNLVENTEVVAPDGQHLVEIRSFHFRTGLTLCDFQGGEELAGKQKAPVKALFMDAAGRLFVHDELNDRETVDNYKSLFDESAEGFGGGGFRGGGGYGGEFGGGEFGGRR